MPPLDQAAMLLALMRDLEEVMRTENALLREMRLERLRALQDEKVMLADGYEAELRRLRASPEAVAALPPEARLALEEAMRRFQATATANARQLEAARKVVEGVVRALGESAASVRRTSAYGPARPAAGGQLVSLALNRRV